MSALTETSTYTGLVDLGSPDPKKITIRAIAHGLSGINRWVHSTEFPVNVAHHSIIAFRIFNRLFPKLRPRAVYALLHDGHEYVLGDIHAPTQRLLALDMPAADFIIERHKARWDAAIRESLGVPHPDPVADGALLEAVRLADLLAADFEWKKWMPSSGVNGRSPWFDLAMKHRHGYTETSDRPLSIGDAAALFETTLHDEVDARRWERTAA